MADFIGGLPEGHVRDWYKNHINPIVLNDLASLLRDAEYTLDPKTGLFHRPIYRSGLKYTLIDIAFLRPTDLHFHEDVEETIRVIGGRGAMIISEEPSFNIEKGREAILPTGHKHAFRPDRNTYLELRIACDGILDPAKEVCVQRFDQVPEWMGYFSSNN